MISKRCKKAGRGGSLFEEVVVWLVVDGPEMEDNGMPPSRTSNPGPHPLSLSTLSNRLPSLCARLTYVLFSPQLNVC